MRQENSLGFYQSLILRTATKRWMHSQTKNSLLSSLRFSETEPYRLHLSYDILSIFSAEGKGIFRLGLSGITFAPLSSITKTPQEARDLIDALKANVAKRKEAGKLTLGLEEQLTLQIERFESNAGGECEIICFPSFFSLTSNIPISWEIACAH